MIGQFSQCIHTCGETDSVAVIPLPSLVPAGQVDPVGGVAWQVGDLECPVGRQEVFHSGGVGSGGRGCRAMGQDAACQAEKEKPS